MRRKRKEGYTSRAKAAEALEAIAEEIRKGSEEDEVRIQYSIELHTRESKIRKKKKLYQSGVARLPIVAALALVLAAGILAGCDSSDYRKAVRANAGISESLSTLQQLNEDAFNAQLIGPEESIALAQGVNDAARANIEFRAQLVALKKLDYQNKAQLAGLLDGVVASVDRLNNEGVLRIKNPESRARFAAIVAGIRTSLAVLQALLIQSPQSQSDCLVEQPGSRLCRDYQAVTFKLGTRHSQLGSHGGRR